MRAGSSRTPCEGRVLCFPNAGCLFYPGSFSGKELSTSGQQLRMRNSYYQAIPSSSFAVFQIKFYNNFFLLMIVVVPQAVAKKASSEESDHSGILPAPARSTRVLTNPNRVSTLFVSDETPDQFLSEQFSLIT